MKVTTLIENRPGNVDSHLAAEWGLSLHIKFNQHNILFDTGSSGTFASNAEHLSIDVASIDTAVLSHHHYDHGGGLKRFFELNPNAKVHLGKPPSGECYTRLLLFIKKYIGLEPSLLANFPDRFVTIDQPAEILPDVIIFPHITGTYPKPAGNKRLVVWKDGKLILDDFSHEIVMAIKENNQLVIFTGCSHNGILNMIETVSREFTGVPIKAVLGGFHLAVPPTNRMAVSREEAEQLARNVLEYPVEKTFTGHCTGTQAYSVLKGVMGDRLADIYTGSTFEI